jgi:TIR domain-containing protein
MSGQNWFGVSASQARNGAPCVFISHAKMDKEYARQFARILLGLSLDIYFDEHDQFLKQASQLGDDEAIVRCIEDGLDNSTHLLGLITQNAKDSWWVTYEIGGAAGRKRECAHFVAPDVMDIPPFIRIHPLLFDQEDLTFWAASLLGKPKDAFPESLIRKIFPPERENLIPKHRKIDEIQREKVGLK